MTETSPRDPHDPIAHPPPTESAKGSAGATTGAPRGPATGESDPPPGILIRLRSWIDALIIAYVLAMFIRMYDVELFKIPTGSMTPTLVGEDNLVETDYDGNGETDLVLFQDNALQVFLRNDGRYTRQVWVYNTPPGDRRRLLAQTHERKDMILVNKFCYLFSRPKRGDIVVFKVPDRPELSGAADPNRDNPWDPEKPIFIKRCVGLPGDTIRIGNPVFDRLGPGRPGYIGPPPRGEISIRSGPATVNGVTLIDPPVFLRIDHFPSGFAPYQRFVHPEVYEVPDDSVFMMGDNAAGSRDSRSWGAVPLENVKGKAILRYWPLREFALLE